MVTISRDHIVTSVREGRRSEGVYKGVQLALIVELARPEGEGLEVAAAGGEVVLVSAASAN